MAWVLDKSRPLSPQICEQVCLHIALGELKPNERLYSVREAALEAGVNPNTVQRSFELLEQRNILYSVRGSGWYVAEDIAPAMETLKNLREEKTTAYFTAMQALGMTPQAIKDYVEEWNI